MHKYFIYGFILCLSVWYNDHTIVETFSLEDLENDLSTSAYFAIDNLSYVKTKLTLEDIMQWEREINSTSFGTVDVRKQSPNTRRQLGDTRRGSKYKFDLREWVYFPHLTPSEQRYNDSHHGTIMRMCHLISITAKAAIYDLKSYYFRRYFYRNLRDFEIGYLTHDIIHTYNILLELYHTMIYQYDMQNFTYFAPPGYMFYIYSNMVMVGKHIIHLCNMMAEIEQKFKGSIAMFNDSTTTLRPDEEEPGKIHLTMDSLTIIRNVTREKQKERQRERKKQIDNIGRFIEMWGANATQTLIFKMYLKERLKQKRQRQPYKSKWPVSYGWSIEEQFKGYSYWSGVQNYSTDIDSEAEDERQWQYEQLRKNRTKEHCNDKINEEEEENPLPIPLKRRNLFKDDKK